MTLERQFHHDVGRQAGVELVLARIVAALVKENIIGFDIFDPSGAEQQLTPLPGISIQSRYAQRRGLVAVLNDIRTLSTEIHDS